MSCSLFFVYCGVLMVCGAHLVEVILSAIGMKKTDYVIEESAMIGVAIMVIGLIGMVIGGELK